MLAIADLPLDVLRAELARRQGDGSEGGRAVEGLARSRAMAQREGGREVERLARNGGLQGDGSVGGR